ARAALQPERAAQFVLLLLLRAAGALVAPLVHQAPAQALEQLVQARVIARRVERVERGLAPPAGDEVRGAVAVDALRRDGGDVRQRIVEGEAVEHRVVHTRPGEAAADGAGELLAGDRRAGRGGGRRRRVAFGPL